MRSIITVIVVGLLLLLGLGLIFSLIYRTHQPAARVQCTWNLGQMGMALKAYHENEEVFPRGTVANAPLPVEQRLSWYVALLPYLQKDPLKFDEAKGWEDEANHAVAAKPLRQLVCPGVFDPRSPSPTNRTTYVGMAGFGANAATLPKDDPKAGIFGYDRQTTFKDVKDHDGHGQTMLVLETAWQNGPWAAGGPPTVRGIDPLAQPYIGSGRPFGGIHLSERPGAGTSETIVLILFADGSVQSFVETMKPRIFEAFATVRGNEDVLGEP